MIVKIYGGFRDEEGNRHERYAYAEVKNRADIVRDPKTGFSHYTATACAEGFVPTGQIGAFLEQKYATVTGELHWSERVSNLYVSSNKAIERPSARLYQQNLQAKARQKRDEAIRSGYSLVAM